MKSSFSDLEDLLSNNHPIIACESPLQERKRLLTHIAMYCQYSGKKAYVWNLNEDSIKQLSIGSENNLVLREFEEYNPHSAP